MATRSTDSSKDRSPVRQPLCPYLARFDTHQKQVAPVDYPSFENHCRAVEGEAALHLTDQATFCLSGSYRLCDRFLVVHVEEEPAMAKPSKVQGVPVTPPIADSTNEELWTQPLFHEKETAWAYRPSRQIWAWASAAIIFAAVLLTGGGVAAYVGWQLALQGQFLARADQNGQIDTLASAVNAQQTPAFLVVTATSEAPAPTIAPPPTDNAVAVPPNSDTPAFPEAVTPTPIVVTAPGAESTATPAATAVPDVILLPTFTQTPVPPMNLVLPGADTAATPGALINVLEAVPTRRPTPSFEVPTDTPIPVAPTITPTLAILGTPVVVFAPDEPSVPPGECTKVRWHVENVREVYYENLPSLGDGSREECIEKETNSYALRVIFGDGQIKIYTTTVGVLWPTPTPTLTPSFTPELPATETWTPEPPTATPTPNVIYAVALRLEGGNTQACSAGNNCEIGVLITNMGDSPDTLSVEFLQRDSAAAWLCRQDGVCAEQKLTLSNVGPNNTAFVVLRVTLPAESAGTTFTYILRGVSEGSQGNMTSEAVTVAVESQGP